MKAILFYNSERQGLTLGIYENTYVQKGDKIIPFNNVIFCNEKIIPKVFYNHPFGKIVYIEKLNFGYSDSDITPLRELFNQPHIFETAKKENLFINVGCNWSELGKSSARIDESYYTLHNYRHIPEYIIGYIDPYTREWVNNPIPTIEEIKKNIGDIEQNP